MKTILAFVFAGLTLCATTVAEPSIPFLQKPLVAREWRGRVKKEKAEEYARYLLAEGVDKIAAINGNQGVQMLRVDEGDAVEFVVISYWPSIDSIKAYAGESYEKPHHLPKDREYLIELPQRVRHYQVLASWNPGPAAK
jgi:heme-degrading monooxygenase HmoA